MEYQLASELDICAPTSVIFSHSSYEHEVDK